MEEEIEKATKILAKLTTERATNPDALIPLDILRRARGIAFIRIAKIGFGFSVKVGTGIVVARLGDSLDSWSAPCAIGTAGVGMGFQWGAELTDFMIVLNTQEAVEAFASGNQVSLGGNVGIAVGPVGRNAGVSGNIHGGDLAQRGEGGGKLPVKIAPCYAYSHSKGLFIGISLEGAVIKPRRDVNVKFYGPDIDSRLILSGSTPPPPLAEPLYDMLAATSVDPDMEQDNHRGAAASASREPVTAEPVAYATANPFNDGDAHTTYAKQFSKEHSKGDEDSTELL
jgi:SH3 domain-containing YSC84-like protein 1